ncbi:endonuclease I [Buchnera aphidicola str. Bp (Baizongia pistaciae)]|uniref:Endonuclease-1 n=1 Tax=Buchnera aphidicola subsp. Baizongia pistaciae (strain Bp) TaxID=224915 RepID=END1_BUCBP|nr:endonuclease [Buchnera aphidicola]Q89AD7.1 RecName: Full=Endonuclease-1; AltName: Full=Endonuclease I; Short=Endo I [Buchnera aphidicola str. Bp (Baizongia pistaciae)]AAO27086.1 endonuclease I [Buchnera aphidicola str. Bp (Baizongia pistaciae)]
MLIRSIFFFTILIFSTCLSSNENIKHHYHKNFNQIKKLAQKINIDAPGTFYCGCKIFWKEKKGIPELNSCGYHIRKNANRANRIEWEHVMPAWQFGHSKSCWKKGGRKNCIHDYNYQKIETDLHNLQPVIGEINGDRSNFMYNQFPKSTLNGQYGQCSMKIDFKNKLVEPPDISKGAISRIYFYMSDFYHFKLSKKQKKLFLMWNKKYNVTNWECMRDNLIFKIQGNHNPYVYSKCQKNNTNKNI